MNEVDSLAEAVLTHLESRLRAGMPMEEGLREAMLTYAERDEQAEGALLRVGHCLGWGSRVHALRHIIKHKSPSERVAAALFCVFRHPDSLAEALECAQASELPAGITLRDVERLMRAIQGMEGSSDAV